MQSQPRKGVSRASAVVDGKAVDMLVADETHVGKGDEISGGKVMAKKWMIVISVP